jgi:hypothetical protein
VAAGDGVGAWRVPPRYKIGLATEVASQPRVKLAVRGIQTELCRRGYYSPDLGTGTFGPHTADACAQFQRSKVLPVDGEVGFKTAAHLWSDHCHWFEAVHGLPIGLLHGLIALESAWDPGAEGWFDPQDRGIAQIRRASHPDVTDELAFGDQPFCLEWTAQRIANAYAGLGVERWEPAIAYHNNPKKARAWAETGEPPDDQIAEYVWLVVVRAGTAPYNRES